MVNKCYIDKNNLLNNIKIIKSSLTKNTKFCAVVKANAYGVGMKEVAQIIKNEVDCFAVANIYEALELRTVVENVDILVLGFVEYCDIANAIKNNICITVISKEYLVGLIEYLKERNIIGLKVHIKINSGLNRFGFTKNEIIEYKSLLFDNHINIVGCFTHFATKENDRDFINKQFLIFKQASDLFNENIVKHCSNTFATLNEQKTHMNMVRVGFGLYGMEKNKFGLKPVVEIESRVINLINLKAGETVGYDRTFRANKDTKIAIIPIGYADGFPRSLSNNFKLYINGKTVEVVGRVCMDVLYLDVTGVDVVLYDRVEILGNNITTTDYADKLNTSSYEVLLNFNKIRSVINIVN